MLSREVKEWLAEYKGLSSAEVNTFAVTQSANEKLIQGIFALFETPPYYVQELDPVCHQLYEFYRSREEKLKLFSLQFVSTLVWLYLRCLSHSDKKVYGGVETFLLGVYNLEIVQPDGTALVESFCIPTISKASIYHESRIPGVTEPLTEHALRSLNPAQSVWRCGPFPHYERFNSQNRFSILTFVMRHYNIHIDSFHKLSLEAMCKAVSRLCNTGFGIRQGSAEQEPRVPVSPSLLIEYMVAVYFAMFNGQSSIALTAVEATHIRASYELYSDVLLISGAILNSHHRGNLKFETTEVSIGAQKTAFVLKNSITNASFKAKKLPDDIDIVEVDENPRLPTVEEDQEHSLAKGLKAKLLNIGGKLGVDKNRNRDAARRDSDTSSLKSGSGSDFVDSVGVVVRNPSGGGKVVVDVLEMQPLRSRANEDSGGDGGGSSNRNSYVEKGSDGKQIRISTSPIVFSKKSGVIRQSSHGASGLLTMNSDSPSKTPLSYTSSLPSSSSLAPPSSLSSHAVNGKAASGSSSSSINSSTNSVVASNRQSLFHSKTNTSDSSHSPRAQSEGPSRDGAKTASSVKPPPSSSPSILSSLSQSFPNSDDSSLHANLSEPSLAQHPSQPPSSTSTHSIPTEILSNNAGKPNLLSQVGQNSCSTDL